jgi:type VI secretion system protein ImpH
VNDVVARPGALEIPRATIDTVAPDSRARPGTVEHLLAHARQYDFFVTVAMLERLTPEAVRVGGDGPYDREAIRFRHDSSLAFSAAEVMSVERAEVPKPPEHRLDKTQHRFEVTTSFLGITGSVSPLPLYLAEEIEQGDEASRIRKDFLDLFHHRVISFVYRVGQKFDFPREYKKDASDAWSRRMLSLAGFDAYDEWRPKHIPRWQMLRLAALFASRVRSGRTIEMALEDVVGHALAGAKVSMKQFSGEWTPLDQEQRMALGGLNSRLGVDSVLGIECFHKAGKATVVIGPLGDNFRRFLADGDLYPVVCEVLGLLTAEPVEFELDLVLAPQARPPFLLGKQEGGRIGFDSWLSSRVGARKETHQRVPLPTELLAVERAKSSHRHAPSLSRSSASTSSRPPSRPPTSSR